MALTESDAIIRASQKAKRDSVVVGPSLGEVDAALLDALNETLRELRIEQEKDDRRLPSLRTTGALRRARLDVYARIASICHPVTARLATDNGQTISTGASPGVITAQ